MILHGARSGLKIFSPTIQGREEEGRKQEERGEGPPWGEGTEGVGRPRENE